MCCGQVGASRPVRFCLSIDVLAEQFDELLLIKQGGRVIFSGLTGKESCHLVEHFQSVEGVPHIQQGVNPATWM